MATYTTPKSTGASGKYRTYARGESGTGKIGSIGGVSASSGVSQSSSSYSTTRAIGNSEVIVKSKEENSQTVASGSATQQTPVSQAVKDLFQGTTTVQVSPGVASKLSGQSLRQDAKYSVSVSPRERTSVSVDPSPQTEIPQKRSFKEKLKEGYEQSPLSDVSRGIKGFFSPRIENPDNFFSDNPAQQAKYDETRREQAAAKQVIPFLYTGAETIIKPRILVEPKILNVKTRAAVRTATDDKAILSSAKIRGEAEIKQPFDLFKKRFTIKGTAEETGKITKQTGLKSGEPIIKTESTANLAISRGKKTNILEITSEGNQVAGLGQRKVFSQLKTSGGGKTIGISSEVETFASSSTDKTIFGGVVGKKSSIYVGEKVLQFQGSKSRFEYFNPETNLRSVTPTNYIREISKPYDVKVYKVLSATQKEIPQSASVTKANVIKILKEEKPKKIIDLSDFNINSGSVTDASRDQIGLISVKQQPKYTSNLLYNQQTEQALKSIGSKNFPSETQLSSVGALKNQNVKTKLVSLPKTNKKTILKSDLSYTVKSQVLNNQKQVPLSKNISESLSQNKFSTGSISRVSNRSASKSLNDLSSKSITGNKTLSKNISSQKSLQSLKSATSSIPAFANPIIASIRPNTTFYMPKVPLISIIKLNKPLFSVDVRRGGVFKSAGVGLSYSDAVRKGYSVVRGSAAATFRVKKGETVVPVKANPGYYLKGLSVIEKNKLRINTPGELGEITFKGIKANRRRKVL